MSLLRTIVGLWKSSEETSERPKLPELKTRYYKERKDRVIDSVLKVAEQKLPRWKVVHVDRERGEIMAEKRHALSVSDIVITVYRISPVRSAIDVVCAKRGSLGDLGSSYRTILEFFHALQTEIQPEEK